MRRGFAWALVGLVLAAGGDAAAGGSLRVVRAESEPKVDEGERDAARRHVVRRVRVVRDGSESGYLGIGLADVGREDVGRLKLEAERGARVKSVADDSPAARAGVKVDDVIVEFDGEAVRSVRQLQRLVLDTPAGRNVDVEVRRDGGSQRLSVELGRAGTLVPPSFHFGLSEPAEPFELEDLPDVKGLLGDAHERVRRHDFGPLLGPAPPRRLGLSYQELSDQLARYFRLEGDGGVLVAGVEEDGPAARAGVKAGDVIVSLDGQAIADGADLRAALRDKDAGQEVTLKLWRDGKPLDLKVKLGGEARGARPRVTT